jgi:hypothetical protein
MRKIIKLNEYGLFGLFGQNRGIQDEEVVNHALQLNQFESIKSRMSSKIVQKNAAHLPRFQDECLRGGCAALSRQKKTPCKSFARGL